MKYLPVVILFLLASCMQKNDNTSKNEYVDTLIQDTSSIVDTETTETDENTIDTLSEALKSFILKDYSPLNASFGDANLDGISDAILVLEKIGGEEFSERPLLLLLGQSNGLYKLAIRNDNIVESLGTSDAHLDSFIGTRIKNGYIFVDHLIAKLQNSWENTTTFKFDEKQENWFLFEEHFKSYTYEENANVETEDMKTVDDILTSVEDFGIISLDKYDVYNKQP